MFSPGVVDLIVNGDMGTTRRRTLDSEQSANSFVCRQYPMNVCHRRPYFGIARGAGSPGPYGVSDAEATSLNSATWPSDTNTPL